MNNYQRIVTVFAPKSTRARRYVHIRPQILDLVTDASVGFIEIRLDDIPYFEARQLIADQLRGGDLVVAAGGDGTAQTAFDAVYRSNARVTYATIPLGNGNDLSRALNGGHRSPAAILHQKPTKFYPLNIVIDGKLTFSLATYITFGATTVLVDYLNSDQVRARRRLFKNLSPAASVSVRRISELSHQISQLNFPDFKRDGSDDVVADDSIGFFVVSAARNILRLPRDITLANSEFFFHHAMTKDKNLAQKIIMAGAWTLKFPGDLSDMEEISFVGDYNNITANVSGDNINLGQIKRLGALRSQRPVTVLYNF